MPYAGFAPIIGSSFDNDAAQNYQWAQANQQTDNANLGRLAQAQEAQNRYWQNLAAMQQQEQARQDRIALAQQEENRRAAEGATNLSESRRQFDINAGLSKEQIANDKARYQFVQDQKDREEKKTEKATANFGDHFAPVTTKAAADLAIVGYAKEEAERDLLTLGQKRISELNVPGLMYDQRTHEIKPANPRMPPTPDVAAKMNAANMEIADKVAAYKPLLDQHTEHLKHWQMLQSEAMKNGFTVDEHGNLYSAILDKTFGKSTLPGRPEAPIAKEVTLPPPPPPTKAPPEGAMSYFKNTVLPAGMDALKLTPSVQPFYQLFGGSTGTAAPPPAPAPPAPVPAVTPTVTTQEQYNALPPGTIYTSKDGRKYRKPAVGM